MSTDSKDDLLKYEKLLDRYILEDKLGSGGQATILKATDTKLDRTVALKILELKNEADTSTLLNEIRKAINLNHENILRYFDIHDHLHKSKKKEILILEYANGGDLRQFMQRKPGKKIKEKIVLDLLKGLDYLHKEQIVHFDLKPENIFLVDKNGAITVKIADFGLSKSLLKNDGDDSEDVLGSLEYMAPERVNPKKYTPPAQGSIASDVWSVGLIIFELFTGIQPYRQTEGLKSEEVIRYKILREDLPKEAESIPEPYREIVKRSLVRDPGQRAKSVRTLLAILEENDSPKNSFWSFKKTSAEPTVTKTEEVKHEILPVIPPETPNSKKERSKDWKLKEPCPKCRTENKVTNIQCNGCGLILKGPSYLKQYKPIKGIFTIFTLMAFTGFVAYPFFQILDLCPWENGFCNIEYLMQDFEIEFRASKDFYTTSAGVFLTFFTLFWIVACISFASWVNKAHKNLSRLNVKATKFSSVFGGIVFALPLIVPFFLLIFVKDEIDLWIPAVGGLFSLLLPYWFMKEIWKGSHPELIDEKGISWKEAPGSFLLKIWWISGLLFPISFIIPFLPGLGLVGDNPPILSKWWWTASLTLMLLSTLLTVILMLTIRSRQKRRLYNIIAAWEHRFSK